MKWEIEKRKQGMEIWVTNSTGLNGQLAIKTDAIFIGECYHEGEGKRTHYLADIIVEALNKHETKSDELAMEDFEKVLKENDSGHQPS
jgi:hypothetical protein|tara:strand:+ start:71 stop:334 length:264 start_codon:yes stop_codon:yes gene_type:complete